MKDFIYEGTVPVIYGTSQLTTVIDKLQEFGSRILIVPAPSFIKSGHFDTLHQTLLDAGMTVFCLDNIKGSMLSKANEGIALCLKENIQAVIGIGGGVCLDLAKTIAFGAVNPEQPLEKYLTYELSTAGLSHLPVVTIPTNPMSGSETNADVQLTFDENGMQVGCAMCHAAFTWLNPEYALSLPKSVLTYGQMTAFAQLSSNYLNVYRSPLAEHYAEASMKTVLECLRISLAEPTNTDAIGTLMLNSALSLSGINDLGRDIEFIPYPLQSFAQRYIGLSYPHAMTILFPYWMKVIYRSADDKAIFKRYFEEILGIPTADKDDETCLQEALHALFELYREFGIATRYDELAANPNNREELLSIIQFFGPMPSQYIDATSETLANIIEDAITGNLA